MSTLPPPVLGYETPQAFRPTFESSAARGRIARICIAIALGLSALTTITSTLIAVAFDIDAAAEQDVLPTWFWPVVIAMGVIGLAYVAALVVAAVFFCRWQHLAHRNVYALGNSPRTTPGWGVASWFIPIVSLFRPYQLLKDISVMSDPERRGFRALGAYWTCWLFTNILSNATARLPDSEAARAAALTMEWIAFAFEVAAAILVFKLIHFIIEAQARAQPAIAPTPIAAAV